MKKSGAAEITHLLQGASKGDAQAQQKLWDEVHSELHRIASLYWNQSHASDTLRPTALINEAYLKLMKVYADQFADRLQFFAYAATVIRNILVDGARRKNSLKRGGRDIQVTFDESLHTEENMNELTDLENLDRLLTRLEKRDSDLGKVVELKYFGGMNNDEIAEVLKISPTTVKRKWSAAKLWLYNELKKEPTK